MLLYRCLGHELSLIRACRLLGLPNRSAALRMVPGQGPPLPRPLGPMPQGLGFLARLVVAGSRGGAGESFGGTEPLAVALDPGRSSLVLAFLCLADAAFREKKIMRLRVWDPLSAARVRTWPMGSSSRDPGSA